MIDLQAHQAKLREKRRDYRARQKERYEVEQSLQLLSEEMRAKARARGVPDLPASDPLKVRQTSLAAALPGLQDAVKDAGQSLRALLDELHAGQDFQELLGELPGDTPFLLFPVRLETRFCRTRFFARPVSKEWLLDFSNVTVPDPLRFWGLQRTPRGTALQVRAPFPQRLAITEAQFNSRIETAVKSGAVKPANGQWLQSKADLLELRIRILPDDINIDSFEENLTPDELERGRQFWQRVWKGDKPEDAWDELRSFFSTPRSAWIVRKTRPLNFVDEGTLPAQPQFPELELRANSYTQAPAAALMPDFFTTIAYRKGQPERLVRGHLVSTEIATGFDPNEPDPTSFQPDDDGDLKFPETLRWIFNFDEAEKQGLAVRIPLSEEEFASGFEKIVVIGVKLSAGKEEGKELLETLFQSQLYQEKGMHIVPQGTPTNNFESTKSGYNWAQQEAADYFKATWKGGHVWSDAQRTDPSSQPDGIRLAQALGIAEEVARHLPRGDRTDALEALAMNRLLFPGTIGYWLRQFFSPPLLEAELDALQPFFEEFVSGRGLLPAIRIGQQPYGILPATTFKFWKSSNARDFTQRLLDQVLKKLDLFWDDLQGQVLFAGDGRVPSDPLSEDLLRLAGHDPASSRFIRQALFGEGYLNFMLRLNSFQYLGHAGGGILKDPPVVNQYQGRVVPELRARFLDAAHFSAFRFMHEHRSNRPLEGPLVDDLPVSEDRALQTFSGSPWNYFDWLSQSPVEALWKEQLQDVPLEAGSPPPVPPKALLYHFARFALRRGALEGALRLLERDEKLRLLKSRDLELLSMLPDTGTEFTPSALDDRNLMQMTLAPLVQALGIQNKFFLTPDRFTYLAQTIGTPGKMVKDILQRGAAPAALPFARQRQAIAVLKDLPTARLERLFAEHLDLCSYRLDAWFNALVLERLSRQRGATASQGIYVGAFGYLENVKPGTPANFVQEVAPTFTNQSDVRSTCLPLVNPRLLTIEGQILDELLVNSFVYLGSNPSDDCRLDLSTGKLGMLMRPAPGSQGFIHAPSPEHAATAAILRAGWQARQSEGDSDAKTLAVRLDSPRVRGSLSLLEGIGQGDSLASLLGYQLDRKLHDSRLDPLIFKLRRLFPLKTDQAANAFAATTDGMAVIRAYDISHTNWGGPTLGADERQKIEPIILELKAQFDALSDLMLTESVFQTVKGSPERAAASLRTLNASGQVHQPEFVRTPQRGSLVVFRTGIVFPTENHLARWGTTLTPRGAVSPKLNNWLGAQLPDPARVIVTVTPDLGTPHKLTLAELDVQPIDLLVICPAPTEHTVETNHLAWLAESLSRKNLALPAATSVKVDFASRAIATAAELTIFELSPLVFHLSKLLAAARHLTAGDFLREGGQGAAPVFEASLAQQALVKVVKSDRQPENLAARILAAKSDLEKQLPATPDVQQGAWSALLDALAETVDWQYGNLALQIPRAFDVAQAPLLLQTSVQAAAQLRKMQEDADVLLTQLLAAPENDRNAICEQLGTRLFGHGFRVCPVIRLTNAPVVIQTRTADLSKNLDALSLENWQCHSALVHPVFRTYRQAALLREALAAPAAEQPLTVLQFNPPAAPSGYWIGAEMRGAAPADDISQSFGGTLSFVVELPNPWNPAQDLSGMVFDEWTEMIPARETTSGVAFHFNQPDTEPPQVVLLAVCPAEGENWRWEYLPETVLDTFARAKKRLINFDHVRTNPALAHLLPAVVAPLERDNLGPTLDMGRNTSDAPIDEKGGAPIVLL